MGGETSHQEDQKWGQMDHGWANRPSSAFSRLARSPHFLGKLPTAAAATIKPDSSWPFAPLPFALPPPITPAIIIFLVQMSFRSCSPDSCSILEPMLGPGGWVLEGHPPGQQSGWGKVVEGSGSLRAWASTHSSPQTPIKVCLPSPASLGVQTLPACPSSLGPSRADAGLPIPSHSLNPAQHRFQLCPVQEPSQV